MSVDYQLTLCWARAVEWDMWVFFVAQPIIPIFYLLFSWKMTLAVLVMANLVWNLTLAVPMARLDWASSGRLWAQVKWASIPVATIILCFQHRFLVAALCIMTPIVAPILGALRFRRQVDFIQEFFVLQLGRLRRDPHPKVLIFLAKHNLKVDDFGVDQ